MQRKVEIREWYLPQFLSWLCFRFKWSFFKHRLYQPFINLFEIWVLQCCDTSSTSGASNSISQRLWNMIFSLSLVDTVCSDRAIFQVKLKDLTRFQLEVRHVHLITFKTELDLKLSQAQFPALPLLCTRLVSPKKQKHGQYIDKKISWNCLYFWGSDKNYWESIFGTCESTCGHSPSRWQCILYCNT